MRSLKIGLAKLKGSMTPALKCHRNHVISINIRCAITGKNHHESDMLVENTLQESFFDQLVCQVETGKGTWRGG